MTQAWDAWLPVIPALVKHLSVVAVDLRGYGESDKPRGVQAYRIETLTADVIGLIHHSDGVPRVHGMHAINHVAGVVRVKPVSSSADPRGGVGVAVRLLAQCVADI